MELWSPIHHLHCNEISWYILACNEHSIRIKHWCQISISFLSFWAVLSCHPEHSCRVILSIPVVSFWAFLSLSSWAPCLVILRLRSEWHDRTAQNDTTGLLRMTRQDCSEWQDRTAQNDTKEILIWHQCFILILCSLHAKMYQLISLQYRWWMGDHNSMGLVWWWVLCYTTWQEHLF